MVIINYTNVSELIDTEIYVYDSVTVVSYFTVNEDTIIRNLSFRDSVIALNSGESLLEITDNCFENGLVKDIICDTDVRDMNESVLIVEELSGVYRARQVGYRNVFGKCKVQANDDFYKIRAIIYRIKNSVQ